MGSFQSFGNLCANDVSLIGSRILTQEEVWCTSSSSFFVLVLVIEHLCLNICVFLFMYLTICISVYKHFHMCIFKHLYLVIWAFVSLHWNICIWTFLFEHLSICICLFEHWYLFIWAFIFVYLSICICLFEHLDSLHILGLKVGWEVKILWRKKWNREVLG